MPTEPSTTLDCFEEALRQIGPDSFTKPLRVGADVTVSASNTILYFTLLRPAPVNLGPGVHAVYGNVECKKNSRGDWRLLMSRQTEDFNSGVVDLGPIPALNYKQFLGICAQTLRRFVSDERLDVCYGQPARYWAQTSQEGYDTVEDFEFHQKPPYDLHIHRLTSTGWVMTTKTIMSELNADTWMPTYDAAILSYIDGN